MKKLFIIPFAMLAVNLTACASDTATLKSHQYYVDHLDEAERIAAQCRKEGIDRSSINTLPEEEVKARSEKTIKYGNCYYALFVDEHKEGYKEEKIRKEKEQVEVNKIKAEIKTFEGKDLFYYLTHLDKAKTRAEFCRNNRETLDYIYLTPSSAQYENLYELSNEDSVYAQNFNLKMYQLQDCSFAIRAVESEEIRQAWLKKQQENERDDKERAEKIEKRKQELAQKYADLSWQEFYALSKKQEDVEFLYTNSSPYEQYTSAAIDDLFFEKGKKRLNEIKSEMKNDFIATIPKLCLEYYGYTNNYPECFLYQKALLTKLQGLSIDDLNKLSTQYLQSDYLMLRATYQEMLNEKNNALRKLFMSDYAKLESARKQCVNNVIAEKVKNTQIENAWDYMSSYFYEDDVVCNNVNYVLKELELPNTLDRETETLINKKLDVPH